MDRYAERRLLDAAPAVQEWLRRLSAIPAVEAALAS